jgi:hypothetical protein
VNSSNSYPPMAAIPGSPRPKRDQKRLMGWRGEECGDPIFFPATGPPAIFFRSLFGFGRDKLRIAGPRPGSRRSESGNRYGRLHTCRHPGAMPNALSLSVPRPSGPLGPGRPRLGGWRKTREAGLEPRGGQSKRNGCGTKARKRAPPLYALTPEASGRRWSFATTGRRFAFK